MKSMKALILAAVISVLFTGTAFAGATYSNAWYQTADQMWHAKDRNGNMLRDRWFCDDAVKENGRNVWYLLDADGNMISSGLVQDQTGNFYSLETNHNGYYGMLRYQSGNYDGIYLELESAHNGSFAAIKNQDGIEKLKALYGVKTVAIGNENITYSSAEAVSAGSAGSTGASYAGSGSFGGGSSISGSSKPSGSVSTEENRIIDESEEAGKQGQIIASPEEASTVERILGVLDAYDSDGAWIVRKAQSLGYHPENYCDSTIVENVDTVVHEMEHGTTNSDPFIRNGLMNDTYYLGNGKLSHVNFYDIWDSSEMASGIPEKLRTFRFDHYVESPSENLSSDIYGIYGLMNEFTAYCWGMHTDICLFDYYRDHAKDPMSWVNYWLDSMNGKAAYAEFRFFILRYLQYSKENYPETYESILANDEFKSVFQIIDKRYRENIETFENSKQGMIDALREMGKANAWFDESGNLHLGDTYWHDTYDEAYDLLMTEMEKEEYLEAYAALME